MGVGIDGRVEENEKKVKFLEDVQEGLAKEIAHTQQRFKVDVLARLVHLSVAIEGLQAHMGEETQEPYGQMGRAIAGSLESQKEWVEQQVQRSHVDLLVLLENMVSTAKGT